MPNAWIVSSRKLTPPAPPPGWLARPSLPEGAARPPVVVVAAGPGDGKTCALLALARAAEAAGGQVAWLALDEDDAALAGIFRLLVAAVRAHIPGFGADLEAALAAAEPPEPKRLWVRAFDELAAWDPPALMLAIDDAHHMGAEGVAALAGALDRLPRGVTLAVATRERAPAGFGRAVARGRAAVVDAAALRFTPAEVEAYLAARAGGVAPDAWRREAERLEGWPLGLELMTAMPPGQGGAAFAGADLVAEFVAEELYRTRPEAERAWLVRAVALAEPSADAARAVLADADAEPRLEALAAAGLLRRVAGADGAPAYAFPRYVRDFLRLEAARTLPATEVAALHARAAAYERDRGRDDLALAHLAAVGDWAALAAAADPVFQAWRWAGRADRIDALLDGLPAAARAAAPALALWTGHRLSAGGRAEEAQGAYAQARRHAAERGDRAGEFRALVRLATLAQRGADAARLRPLMMQAQALAEAGDPADRADFLLLRSLAADLRGDLALAAECNEAVLAEPVGGDPELAMSHVIALMNLYTLALNRGELTRARRWVDRAAAIAEAHGFRPAARFCGFLRAQLDLDEDRAEEAAAFLRALPVGWEEDLDWHERACAWLVLGAWQATRGELREAEALYGKALAAFEAAGFEEGCKLPLERLVRLAILRGQPGRSAAYVEQAGALGEHSVYDLALQVAHARALHLAGEPAEAAALLGRAAPALAGLGARLHEARARLYEAAALATAGDPAAAARAEAAQALVAAGPFPFLLTQDRRLRDELAAIARSHTGAPHRVGDAAPPARTAPARPEARDRPAARKATPAPAGRLAIRCFGALEARVDGAVVDEWPRRKAKLVLAALALVKRGLAGVQLAELFDDQGFTPNGLQVTVSALRRALEPARAGRHDASFLTFADDRYQLRWDAVAFLDVAAFDAERAAAEACRRQDPETAAARYEAALAHYRGELLDEPLFAAYFEAEREQYRREALAAALWLGAHHEAGRRAAEAEAAWRRAVAIAPADEQGYMGLARHHAARGARERAVQACWDCRKALKARLGIAPSAELEAIHRGLVGGP